MQGAESDREARQLPTTYMFRNLPRTCTAHDLMAELCPYAGEAAIDFLYCPWDKAGDSSMGFGFVNFADGRVARSVCSAVDGTWWRVRQGRRPIRVHPAHLQGSVPNLVRYCANNRGAAIDDIHCPLVFQGGRRLTLHEAVAMYIGWSMDLGAEGVVPQPSNSDASTGVATSASEPGEQQGSEDSHSTGAPSLATAVQTAIFEDEDDHFEDHEGGTGAPCTAGSLEKAPAASAAAFFGAAACSRGGGAHSCASSACSETGLDLDEYAAAWSKVNRLITLLQQRQGFHLPGAFLPAGASWEGASGKSVEAGRCE